MRGWDDRISQATVSVFRLVQTAERGLNFTNMTRASIWPAWKSFDAVPFISVRYRTYGVVYAGGTSSVVYIVCSV